MSKLTAKYEYVPGLKSIKPITKKKMQFLKAAQRVIEDLRDFWPLSVRQVHYGLLNDPPLISTPERSKFDIERYRYRNDEKSYKALIELLKQARYQGLVAMDSIDDPTRPIHPNQGWSSISEFVTDSMNRFLVGYRRDLQQDQPVHIEVVGEKNTLLRILQPVCKEYCVPLTLSRGYGTTPIWREIAYRFRKSGKTSLVLIVASDFDPEGLDLAKDATRSLRDVWELNVHYHRLAVSRDQIDQLDLSEDFNPAKKSSTRFKSFVGETGSEHTWELEALPPEYLQNQLRSAIESNMDMDLYQAAIEQEREEASELKRIRNELIRNLKI